jgi:hypothetical protein
VFIIGEFGKMKVFCYSMQNSDLGNKSEITPNNLDIKNGFEEI